MAAHEDHGLIKLATIVKAHGLNGEVIAEIQHNREALESKTHIFIRDRRGDLTPYQIEDIKEKQGGEDLFFVKLAFINDRTSAERLTGASVFGEAAGQAEIEQELPDDLSGWDVLDKQDNIIGQVEEFMDMPAHPVITIKLNTSEMYLVPFVDEYITAIDEDSRRISVKNLDQLDPEE